MLTGVAYQLSGSLVRQDPGYEHFFVLLHAPGSRQQDAGFVYPVRS